VGRAADAFGLTHRQVIALFDQHVGLKPKSYQRVRRARRVMKAGAAVHRPQWAQIAASSGYYDQAHMINDFRRLTGMTPRGYLARRSSVGHGFVPHQVVPDR
jgi:AraC-like DNA-binding protein